MQIRYAGYKWTRKSSGYYQNTVRKTGKQNWLHRFIYEETNGKIDSSMHVHHKNHDKEDNRPINLELLSHSYHAKMHGDEKRGRKRDEPREAVDKRVCLAKLAKQGGYIGKAKRRAINKGNKHRECLYCKTKFTLKDTDRNDTKYCSEICNSRWHKLSKNPEFEEMGNRKCIICDTRFKSNSHNQRCCSSGCQKINRRRKNDANKKPAIRSCDECGNESIKFVDVATTYNFEVEKFHNYLAGNNYVVHNCIDCMAQLQHLNIIRPSDEKEFKPNPDTGVYELVEIDYDYEGGGSSYIF